MLSFCVIVILLGSNGISEAKRRNHFLKINDSDTQPENRDESQSVTKFLLNLLSESQTKNDDLQDQLDAEKLTSWKLKTENVALNASLQLKTEELVKEQQHYANQSTSTTTAAPPPPPTSTHAPTPVSVSTTATTTAAAPQPPVYVAVACERTTLKLECFNAKVLKIVYANYGRTEGQNMCPSRFLRTTSCYSANSWIIVSNRCQNQCQCSVAATNAVFSDPCVGTNKYLKVYYQCV